MDNDTSKKDLSETAERVEYVNEKEAAALKNEQKAAEKLDRLNGVFDRLIVPIIIFTILLIVGAGVVPKWVASCAQDGEGIDLGEDIVLSQGYSFYAKRSELLSDIEANAALFEEHGYQLMDSDDSGCIAYRKLDSGTEIMENLADQNGNRYSVAIRTEGGTQITLMIYSRSIFLAIAEADGLSSSAIFGSDSFVPDVSDSDAAALYEMITADQLKALMAEYKASMEELF